MKELRKLSPMLQKREQAPKCGSNEEGKKTLFQIKDRRLIIIIIIIIITSGVRLSLLGTAAAIGLSYQSQIIDDGDCGAIGGMKIGSENRSTRRKAAPVPLCSPKSHMT
jgi:hypothetical protein